MVQLLQINNVSSSSPSSPFSFFSSSSSSSRRRNNHNNLITHKYNHHKTLFLPLLSHRFYCYINNPSSINHLHRKTKTVSTLLETPIIIWAGRLCIFYALLKSGFAGSPNNPILSGEELGLLELFQNLTKPEEKEAANRRKLVSKWHPTTKGTLRRNYRIPSKSEGKRLLKAIASLLSDDDHFRDATSHKGCQIRRESAHGESVCCNNVRALFDELPTPHLIVEITPFPAGPLSQNDYSKAEKLEKVLRSGPSV